MASFPNKSWTQKFSRTGYFLGAVVLHLVVFVMVATLIVFPPKSLPTPDSTTFIAPAPPLPPTVPPPAAEAPRVALVHPASVLPEIKTPANVSGIIVPPMPATTANIGSELPLPAPPTIPTHASNSMSPERREQIRTTILKSRDLQNVLEADTDPRNVVAKFPVYLAAYADGDWNCNNFDEHGRPDGRIVAGSLPNLIAKINEWSRGKISAQVQPQGLNIGGPDLMDRRPPLIFFTGHKDFRLTELEVQNLRDYLQVGGLIWGDSALPGTGSRFDVAFRREMKRVIPDLDKNFEAVADTSPVFASWFPLGKVPEGMNYYDEPIQHIDLDGKLAILYSPNDYSDMLSMRILPGDIAIQPEYPAATSPLFTSGLFWYNQTLFFRNFNLASCLSCDQFGMNIVAHALVRFDKDLL